MSSALPAIPEVDLSDEQRAPLLSAKQRALKHIWRHIYARDEPGVRPVEISGNSTGWHVTLARDDEEGSALDAGYLELTHDFELLRDEVR